MVSTRKAAKGKSKVSSKKMAAAPQSTTPGENNMPGGSPRNRREKQPAAKVKGEILETGSAKITGDNVDNASASGVVEMTKMPEEDMAVASISAGSCTEAVAGGDEASGGAAGDKDEEEPRKGADDPTQHRHANVEGEIDDDKVSGAPYSVPEQGPGEVTEGAASKGNTSPAVEVNAEPEKVEGAKPQPAPSAAGELEPVGANLGLENATGVDAREKIQTEIEQPGGHEDDDDSSDDEDGDGFRIVVGREVALSTAPAAPAKRFLRGTNTLVNTSTTSSAGGEETRSTPPPKPVSAAAGIASLVPSKGAPATKSRPSLKPGEYPPTAELQQSSGKTAFDVDIDGMEEQPWRHPGVDIADFFNYGFTEDSWRVYCEKQLRNRYDLSLGRSKNSKFGVSRGSSSSHMRYGGGGGSGNGARRGGDRPSGMERSVQPHNKGPKGSSFPPQGPPGNSWGSAGQGPDRFSQGFQPGPPSGGHGNAPPPWFDSSPGMRSGGQGNRQNFAPRPKSGMDSSVGMRRSRSPVPRDGPSEKMARNR